MIQLDTARCIGCGLCVQDCFPAALSLAQKKAQLSAPQNCIGCGHCIAICPRNAVSDDSLPMDDVQHIHTAVSSDALLNHMRSRRSCRHYRPDPIPDAVLNKLLQAARACPTAKNAQATRYILVTKQIHTLLDSALDTLGEIGTLQYSTAKDPSELRRAENFIHWAARRKTDKSFDPLFFHAPMLLLFIAEAENIRDAASAASYTELMAAALGLGCLYSGYFTACAAGSREIQKILGLVKTEQVVRCLVLGYPDIQFERTAPRKSPNVLFM